MYSINRYSRVSRLLATFLVGLLHSANIAAAQQGRSVWERVEAIQTLLGGAVPQPNAVRLDLPSVTQDGSSVLLTAEIDSPMTPDEHIEALYFFALGNPSPELAEIHFTPLAGQARVSTRIRLDSSQTVVALARTSGGDWLSGSQDVRVTVSGCFSRDATYKADDHMQTRVRIPPRFRAGQATELRTLINHPMETGLRKNAAGQLIPERIIHVFRATLDGEPVLTARLHRAIAANPYLVFHMAPEQSGELTLSWEEDTGETTVTTAEIRVD